MNHFLSLFLFVVAISFSEGLICLYGGYCQTTAECVAGAQCQFSIGYSQCVPIPATNCIAQYGTCGGIHMIILEEKVDI